MTSWPPSSIASFTTVISRRSAGNSCRIWQHTDLWQTMQAPRFRARFSAQGDWSRAFDELRLSPLVDLSDFQSAELSDFEPALTSKRAIVVRAV